MPRIANRGLSSPRNPRFPRKACLHIKATERGRQWLGKRRDSRWGARWVTKIQRSQTDLQRATGFSRIRGVNVQNAFRKFAPLEIINQSPNAWPVTTTASAAWPCFSGLTTVPQLVAGHACACRSCARVYTRVRGRVNACTQTSTYAVE